MNLLAHRDYAFRASSLISIYTDRIEFVSVGGLLPGIDREDIMAGISVCRNQNLADVFYRLELIEAYGTGIRKILNAYRNADRQPVIETTNNTFKITLPNVNYGVSGKKAPSLTEMEKQITDFVKQRQYYSGRQHRPHDGHPR